VSNELEKQPYQYLTYPVISLGVIEENHGKQSFLRPRFEPGTQVRSATP